MSAPDRSMGAQAEPEAALQPAVGADAADLLNPLTLPLDGTRLIEASAGTGKTWTIAALVLRLVLGHGPPAPAGTGSAGSAGAAQGAEPVGRNPLPATGLPPLAPSQILVMTFTRAATRELADRIRQRLVQAAAVFRGETAAPQADAFLVALLAAHPPGHHRQAAAHRLAMAAEAMDDAAVLTIDAWCQRLLREHAFDSGCLFDEDLQADDRAMRLEAAADFWRREVYPLGDAAMALLRATWPSVSVQVLVDELGGALDWLPETETEADAAAEAAIGDAAAGAAAPANQPGARPSAAADLADLLAAPAAELAALKPAWVSRFEAMRGWLLGVIASDGNPLHKGHVRADAVRDHLQAWIDWATIPGQALPEDFKTLAGRYTEAWLLGKCAKGKPLPPGMPEGFALLADLVAALADMAELAGPLRLHAARRMAQRYRALQREARAFGFADLLRRLDQALDVQRQGERALRLRQRILTQTPVAMVDEFQDTSAVQLSIFDRLYGLGDAGGHGRALLLIGDPKQSIYRFRGADIHSYLRARAATQGRHHRLGTNHRSTEAVVAAVNRLFSAAEQRPGAGAFMMRSAAPDSDGPSDPGPGPDGRHGTDPADSLREAGLPFVPVRARGRSERLVSGRGPVPALVAGWDARPVRAPLQMRHMAESAANEIVALLGDAQAGFVAPDGSFQRLRPADVAVLVRTAREAQAIRRALGQRAVASVYLSDQDSVLASAEALDVLRLLRAIASPRDVRLARAALATGLLGRSLAELQQLAQDDVRLDAELAQLTLLHAVWQQQGVLSMLRRLLHGHGLPARWLAPSAHGEVAAERTGGERRLTNVLHLAELLQQASSAVEGEAALVRWLAAAIDECARRGGRAVDEQVLRLESDADLVQVVTIHKSKGLEYPVVFLPFVVQHRAVGGRGPKPSLVVLPDGQGGNRVVMAPDAQALAEAETERLREDLRLLYVALTRARHALWLGLQPLDAGSVKAVSTSTWSRSAIGRLISGGNERRPEQVAADVHAWLAASPEVALQPLSPAQPPTGAPGADGASAERPAGPPAEPGADRAETLAIWPATAFMRLMPQGDAAPLSPPPRYAAGFDRDWGIASYSVLVASAVAGSAGGPADAAIAEAVAQLTAQESASGLGQAFSGVEPGMGDGADAAAGFEAGGVPEAVGAPPTSAMAPSPGRLSGRALLDDEPMGAPAAGAGRVAEADTASGAAAPWHLFPRGALAGHVLHGLLEWLAGEGFALADAPHLEQSLRQRCERQGWGARADDLLVWLRAVCGSPIAPLGGLSLRALPPTLPEMEFWMPADGLDTQRLDALCRQHLWPGVDRPSLAPRQLQGLLMGFADLCFMHQGRAWVADYKSNALGTQDAAYTEAAMAEAVRHHRYDVQAVIYQFALHRLLRLRLGQAYSPQHHLGGTLFLFLRGIQGPERGVLFVPPLVPVMQALDAMVSGAPTLANATARAAP